MGMGQELNKQWEWESIRMGMGMTPIPMGMHSHQRLRKIVVEYSNKSVSYTHLTLPTILRV